jgi:putative DNA primase/helicase
MVTTTTDISNPTSVLNFLLKEISPINFRDKVALTSDTEKLKQKHFRITAVEEILKIADEKNWGICINNGFTYLYNGAYWLPLDNTEVQNFLGKAALNLGIEKYDAKDYEFQEKMYKQFCRETKLSKPQTPENVTSINLLNGTFDITAEIQQLRPAKREDFLTYQLPFKFDPKADCLLFKNYLNTVLPDKSRQDILAEYIGYLFVKPKTLKLEKTLLLYGSGANGKSVFFEIVNALLGGLNNVSNFSLQSLTNENGYYRAMLANKLVNYASEINGKLEASIFKQLVSGEPVEARLPYGEPFTLTNYAKLIFNCNELPSQVEHTNAYFRRFLIVPFDVTIPPSQQDKDLPNKIVASELSGVFNWVLDGLKRLLENKQFTFSQAVEDQVNQYKKQSDSIQLFLEEENYIVDLQTTEPLRTLFAAYRVYCNDNGYYPVSNKTFAERLRQYGFVTKRQNSGTIVHIKKSF